MRTNLLLQLNLQFFAAEGSEGGTPEGGPAADKDTETPEGQTDPKPDDQKETNIPKSRFDEVNNKLKDALATIDEITKNQTKESKAKEKAEKEAREKAGEFEGLYNETKTTLTSLEQEATAKTERIGALETVIEELLTAELNDIDKEFHDLIPQNLTVEAKLSWIAKAKAKGIFGKNEVETPIGGSTNPAQQAVKTENLSAGELFRLAFSKK